MNQIFGMLSLGCTLPDVQSSETGSIPGEISLNTINNNMNNNHTTGSSRNHNTHAQNRLFVNGGGNTAVTDAEEGDAMILNNNSATADHLQEQTTTTTELLPGQQGEEVQLQATTAGAGIKAAVVEMEGSNNGGKENRYTYV